MAKETEFPDYEPLKNPAGRLTVSRSRPVNDSFVVNDSFPRSPRAEPEQVPVAEPVSKTSEGPSQLKQTLLRRGHAVSFLGLLVFTAFVYFRPYEWPGLAFLSTSAKWLAGLTLLVFVPSQLALEGNLTTRPREVNLILLLSLCALLSLTMAISIEEGWDNFTEFLKVVAMFIVMVNVVRTERRLRWMFWIALAVSLTMSITAISDYQAGRLNLGGERIKGSIGGLFENPNDLALHLVTMVPLAVGLFFARRGISKKLIYGVATLVMVAAIICTFSRGGFLGLIAVALVLAWKFGRKHRLTVVVVCFLAIGSMVALAPAEYGGRLSSIWGGDATGSANARQELFWRSIYVAARYPLFGVGIGNFHFRSLREQVSHNSFTQVASELGVPATIFYVLLIITPIKRLRRIERETMGDQERSRFYYLSIGLQASLIGYMVSSFFASVAFLWYVYYLVGYAFCMSRLYESLSVPVPKEAVATSKSAWIENVPAEQL